MKKSICLFTLLLISFSLSGQALIGTKNSLLIVYNYTDNYFYIRLDGKDKRKSGQETVFIIDNRPVQVIALNKKKFLSEDFNGTGEELLQQYIKWESDYIKETLRLDVNHKIEAVRSNAGNPVILWEYDMPSDVQKKVIDSVETAPTQKQMFVIRMVKDYVVGINMPLFDAELYEKNKEYMLRNIDNIVTSQKEFDLEELYKQQINN